MPEISFKLINSNANETEIIFLFELLKEREFNISHYSLPSFDEHKKFILSNPYYKFAIIFFEKRRIGSIYLKDDNTVGLHLLKKFEKYTSKVITSFEENFKPLEPIKSYRTSSFCFYVSPKDNFRKKILLEKDYEIVSITFKKRK